MRRIRPESRRAEITRAKLLQSFVQLVLTRGYEEISTAEVAARAGVGRSTFYTHFAGLLPILEASLEWPCTALAASVHLGACPGDLHPLLEHMRDQSRRNAVFFREPICSLWARCLAQAIAARLRRDPHRHRHRPCVPIQALSSVLADLQIAVICRWLAAPSGMSADAVARTLSATTQRLVFGT